MKSMLSDTAMMESEMADVISASDPIRTLVADDLVIMQEALVSCAESMPGVQVIARACNGAEAIDKAREHRPNLAIVDLQMPVMDGFQVLRELRASFPGMRLVAVSGHSSPTVVREALLAGANAFVSKSELPYGLVKTLEEVLAA